MKKIQRKKIKSRGRFYLRWNPLQNIQDSAPIKPSTRHRILGITAVCLVLILITSVLGQTIAPLNAFYGKIVSPFQKAYLTVDNFISDLITTAKRMRSLESENQELTEQLELYVFENATLRNDVAKLDEMQALYELDNYYEAYPKTGAQIVGLSNNNWYDTFIIDKGSEDGLAKNMPVLASGGLIGHISNVYANYSVVTSIIDGSSCVFGEVNRKNRDTVSVYGTADRLTEGLCRIEYDPQSTDLVVGDDIVTSALGDVYPPGLLIGTVTEIEKDSGGIGNIAYVKPACDLEIGFGYVLVITELWKDDLNRQMEEGEENP